MTVGGGWRPGVEGQKKLTRYLGNIVYTIGFRSKVDGHDSNSNLFSGYFFYLAVGVTDADN